MSAPRPRPWPGPLHAVGLTALAAAIAVATGLVTRGRVSPTVSLGLSLVVGLGCAGALGAAYVPPPHAERMGLIRVPARRLLAALLLTPAVLWSQEAATGSGPPSRRRTCRRWWRGSWPRCPPTREPRSWRR